LPLEAFDKSMHVRRKQGTKKQLENMKHKDENDSFAREKQRCSRRSRVILSLIGFNHLHEKVSLGYQLGTDKKSTIR
jgi:hypothetical protein